MASSRINRRQLLSGSAALLGAAGSLTREALGESQASAAKSDSHGPSVNAASNAAVVTTTAGEVGGYVRHGIYTFKGIPYGGDTSGANRFQPPHPPKPWTGVRSSRQYGPLAPQKARVGAGDNDEEAFMMNWNDDVARVYGPSASEDCLRVNLWTPAPDNAKRPVMVWLHGGGFSAGSGNEQAGYDGENLARQGDVVVVSLNHRLNVLGYLNLAAFGDRYADSANVGMLDLVLALKWVRDNIARFGGDPGCVTIFGQSGGGGKVGALMAMPAAQGLFHRAIVESGSMLRAGTQEGSTAYTKLILAELNLGPNDLDQLQTMPWQQLIDASDRALHKPTGDGPVTTPPGHTAARPGFSPVVDGRNLPAHPFDPTAPAMSADMPMIVGTTLNEFTTALNHPELERMTDAEMRAKVTALYGAEKMPAMVTAFRARTPAANPFELWSRIATAPVRENAIKQCTAKAALGKAPAYLYWFTWQTPILDGRPMAFHCSEISFVFRNTDVCDTMTGGGPDARALSETMSSAWVQFARTGDPNHAGMAKWEPFSTAAVPTMIFDNQVRLERHPDQAEQESLRHS
ncbi:MAG: carboxylesterase/lipase family protein [Janthinobacterium lividum]